LLPTQAEGTLNEDTTPTATEKPIKKQKEKKPDNSVYLINMLPFNKEKMNRTFPKFVLSFD